MNEIQPLIDALQDKLPWLAALTSFMGLARLLAKPISALVQSFFSKLVLFIQGTPETDDDAWLERVLGSKPYRFFAFVVDWVLSIKLPSSASVQTLKAGGPDDGSIAGRVGLFLLCGCLSFGVLLAVTTGCSTSQQRVAYNTLATVQTVTVGAYDAYVAQVIAGNIKTNDLPRIARQFNLFQASFLVALDAVQNNTNALAPESLTVLSGDLLNLINTVTKEKP